MKYHVLNGLFWFVFLSGLAMIYLQAIDGSLVRKPITFGMDTMALRTDKSVYKPGDTVYAYFSYCKKYDYTNTSAWSIDDSIIRPFPSKTFNVPVGCRKDWFPVVVIPTDVAFIGHEEYYLEGISTISVNPMREISIHYKSVQFTIIPNVRTLF